MPERVWRKWCLSLVVGTVLSAPGWEAHAACVVETPKSETKTGLVLHLGPDCTMEEREARLVRGNEIVEAITRGERVDLIGVIVRGDVILDRLGTTSVRSKSGSHSPVARSSASVDDGESLVVHGAVTIRDSIVLGGVRHRSATGKLQFDGPVDFQGSRFREGVDLSRSIFQDTVELSGATLENDALFVQGDFGRGMGCRDTKFGPSTRFHRSVFRGPVDCTGALFDGMAEWLEVSFEGAASFERGRFGLGTGFSGSRFAQQAKFSDAIFSRETFFAFTRFEGHTTFAGAQFLGPADFSQAEFKERDDLSAVRFDQPPDLRQTKRIAQDPAAGFMESKAGQYTFTLLLLVVAAALAAYMVRMK